jgi:hypothetical protein
VTSTLTRYALYIALAASLVLGGFAYRSHVYSTGFDAGELRGVASERTRSEEARRLAGRAADLTSERAAALVAADLQSLKDQHARTVSDLSKALADSDHRNQRLSDRVAGLLDEAAGLRAGATADPSGPGGAPGTPGADQAVASVGDLADAYAENMAVCRRNSTRLERLQGWYADLRAGRE